MTRGQAEKGSILIDKIDKLTRKLSELKRSDIVDTIQLRRYQSGAPEFSYEVNISDDQEFLQMVKVMTIHRLEKRMESLNDDLQKL